MHRRAFFIAVTLATVALAADDPLIAPVHRITPNAPEWSDLVNDFARQPDIAAGFEERRFFPFRKEPVILQGEVRVSRARGLSLHYLLPDERTIVLDDQGMVMREQSGQKSPPPDPRASAANDALLRILRLDFAGLAGNFEIYGQRDGANWSLALVPRAEALRRTIGDILVTGESAAVRRIELRRSAKQHIDILIEPPRPPAAFTPEEVQRYFR